MHSHTACLCFRSTATIRAPQGRAQARLFMEINMRFSPCTTSTGSSLFKNTHKFQLRAKEFCTTVIRITANRIFALRANLFALLSDVPRDRKILIYSSKKSFPLSNKATLLRAAFFLFELFALHKSASGKQSTFCGVRGVPPNTL